MCPALLICFHFLRSEAEILHNEAWRVKTSPLLTVLGEKAESEVIQGERKRPEESPGMKNGMGAEGLRRMASVGWMVGRGEWV